MKRYSKIFFIVLITLASCASSSNLRLYYYPIYDLELGKVYAFRSSETFNRNFFVALKSRIESGNQYMYIEMFDAEFKLLTSAKELLTEERAEVVEFGVNLDSIITYIDIKSKMSFFWDFTEPTLLMAKFENNEFKIKRMFQNAFVNYLYQGVDYPAAHITQEGSGELYKYAISEYNMTDLYFAKGIGMIAFKIAKPGGKKEEFVLDKMLNMNEWRILRGVN
ncbi:MAG: hypothetical protein CVV22_12715 [Ignavibacteriae bacterium HGW-Ignavibacteriae-1]|nr:MAG: hypothetical protein CVV22_12715 [Ignavibacteriae bacterium HGW-Ignavibacteriae-1]